MVVMIIFGCFVVVVVVVVSSFEKIVKVGAIQRQKRCRLQFVSEAKRTGEKSE